MLLALTSREFAYVVLAAMALFSVIAVVLAIRDYRATMRRPWPKVAPLTDDDDD